MQLRFFTLVALVVALAACTPPVINSVGDVIVTPATATVVEGAIVELSAEVEVVSGTPPTTVTWSSSDTTVATVNATTGVVTGVSVGTATVTATSTFDDEASGSAMITVVAGDPTSIADTATAAGFTTLVAALVEADLAATFADDDAGPFTVFAPTDDAFEALLTVLGAEPADLLGRADLADILGYHVVNGEFLAADILALIEAGDGTALIETLTGDDLVVTLVDGNVTLNGTITVGPVDIIATNGVIHVIDGVLTVPMSFDTDTDYADYTGDADVNAPFSLSFPEFSGGLSPYSFEVTTGALPADFVTVEFEETPGVVIPSETYAVELNANTGEISGSTGYPGVFTGTVTVTDAVGASLTADFTLNLGLVFRLTAGDLVTTEDTFSYPDFTAPGPYIIVPGNRVQVSGVGDTEQLPLDFLDDLLFTLAYTDSNGSRAPTSEEIGDTQGTGTFRINIAEGTISQYSVIPEITQWLYDVTVTYAGDVANVIYPVRFHHTSDPFID